MAKTEFGQELSSQSANDVYLLKTEDDIITGVLSLQNDVDINKHLTDTQEHIYTVGQIIGILGENDPNALIYSSVNYIANGDNRKVAIEKLDGQVKLNADNIALNVIAIAQNATDIATNASDIADIIASLGVDSVTAPLAVGIATLDADGKVPLAQIPNSLLQYLGTWDASSNTPTLADGTGVENTWYRVNVAGSQDLGSGSITFAVGDKIVHNGTIWEKWDTNDEVTSVHGRTGDVVALAGDYNATQVGLGNVTDDAQLKREAGDLNTFTEKASPVDADIVIIEDSEDSFNKKKVLLENLGLGGGGQGGINHLLEPSQDAALWTNDTNFSISNNSTDPIREQSSGDDLLLTKTAVNAINEIVRVPFTIDKADRGKKLPLTFDFINSSTYTDNLFELEIFDNTNAGIVRLSNKNILSRDTIIGSHVSYWDAAIDSTSYELRFKIVDTNADLVTMNIENLKSGPINLLSSSAFISDWENYSPSGTWTSNASYTGQYRRVGGDLEGWVEVEATAVPTPDSHLLIDIPSGLSIDASRLPPNVDAVDGHYIVGDVSVRSSGQTYIGRAALTTANILSGKIECYYDNNAVGSQDVIQTVTVTGGTGIQSGDFVKVSFKIPIVGWDTGNKPNEIVSGRESTVIVTANSAQPLPLTTFTKLTNWGAPSFNKAGAWDVANNRYVAQENCTCIFNMQLRVGPDGTNDLRRILFNFYVNGVPTENISTHFSGSAENTMILNGMKVIPLNKEDVVEVYAWQDNADNQTVNTTASIDQKLEIVNLNYLSSREAPNQTLVARYTTDSGQALAASPTNTTIVFEDKEIDLYNAMDTLTGIYPFRDAGRYLIISSFEVVSTAWSANNSITFDIQKNGVSVQSVFERVEVANSKSLCKQVVGLIDVVPEDNVRITIRPSVATNLSGSSTRNNIAIIKVSN